MSRFQRDCKRKFFSIIMTFKRKFLAIIGSQRKNRNSYLLAKTMLESVKVDYEIIQLAKKELKFCNLCGKCENEECPLDDDFNQIVKKMKMADGIIFSFPRYFFLSSKFLCFIEKLVMPYHFKKYHGYEKIGVKPDSTVSPPFKGKPCCLFAVSDTGWMGKEPLKLIAHEVEVIGMKVIGKISLKTEEVKKVIEGKKTLASCKKLIKKLIHL